MLNFNLRDTSSLPYPVLLEASLLKLDTWFPQKQYSQLVILTDTHVNALYGARVKSALLEQDYNTILLDFEAGETAKNASTMLALQEAMLEQKCDKNTLLLTLGGGVVGDLGGFIAATFLRGIDYVQLPTTLLAMVDSSIGGKTGINTRHGKNLIGAIYRPQSVVIDLTVLKTLPPSHLFNGLVEAAKMFITFDAMAFHNLLETMDLFLKQEKECLKETIQTAIAIKAAVVRIDEKEQNLRHVLNFGHTIGHALEKNSNYQLLHGYAVGYGILVESMLSYQLGFLDQPSLMVIQSFLSLLGIKGEHLKAFNPKDLLASMLLDKKRRKDQIYSVLLKTLGEAYVQDGEYIHLVTATQIETAIKATIRA